MNEHLYEDDPVIEQPIIRSSHAKQQVETPKKRLEDIFVGEALQNFKKYATRKRLMSMSPNEGKEQVRRGSIRKMESNEKAVDHKKEIESKYKKFLHKSEKLNQPQKSPSK
jgi:TPP-dependent indolepyruvate ferredoxin oxidoreductase alpha subunit